MQYRNPRRDCQPAWKILVDNLLAELLPMACLLCGGACTEDNICPGCLRDLPRNDRACLACGLACEDRVQGRCGRCLDHPPAWDRLHAPLRYEFPADVLVRMLKYHRKLSAGPALARAMVVGYPVDVLPAGAAFIPVPLHWSRRAVRGYNQARELGIHLSKRCGIPFADGRLRRSRSTRSQTGLDATARRRNLRDAFYWRGADLEGRNIILVDDVMTTGSTAVACAKVLRRAGAGRIEVWVAARAAAPG